MIDSIIIKYLQENRRLVIPKLGAFIVKDDNQTVIFSELLRSDDGVLRGLIKNHGVGDIEAAGVIDRFAFEVRHTLDRNMPYKIRNWGTLRRDDKGKIIFMSFRTQLQQPVHQAPRPVYAQPTPTPIVESTPEKPRAVEDVEMPEKSSKKQPARHRKPDLFMIVAVVVSILAVCAILYGVLCNKSEEEQVMPFPEVENTEQAFNDAIGDDITALPNQN